MENKLVPKVRFSEFKANEEWEDKSIGDFAKVTAGGTPDSTNANYWNGEIPWMNSGELNLKRVYAVSNKITQLGLKESSTRIIPKNCVLIGLAGQGKTRGTAAINYIELCTNQSIASIHPNPVSFNSEFLYHKIDSIYDELRLLSTGEGGRGGLNLQIIKSLKIALPSIKEQKKIADCLFSLDDLITVETEKLGALREHKRGLMQNLFPAEGEKVPKLRFPEFKGNGDWEEKKLGTFMTYFKGFAFKSIDYSKNGVRIVRVSDLGKNQIKDNNDKIFIETKNLYEVYKILRGDIIITTVGSKPELVESAVGRPIFVKEPIEALLNQNLLILRPIDDNYLSYFIYCQLLKDEYSVHIKDIQRGNANQSNITVKDLLEFRTLLPFQKEQQKIANCLSSLDEQIDIQIQKIEDLKLHKKGLMQQLFPTIN
ncbi:EcoKI restriction-modification system protein HsdS [compost metagenome]